MKLRNKLEIELYCSKHPNERLFVDIDKYEVSTDSICSITPKTTVRPCEICENELDRIKYSIKTLMDIKNEDGIKPLQDLDDAK